MYLSSRDFRFESSHSLPHLSAPHKARINHGHSYVARVCLSVPHLGERGFVVDYDELEPIARFIAEYWDGNNLNDVVEGVPTTAENLAQVLYGKCKSYKLPVVAVGIKETHDTWAWFVQDLRFFGLAASMGG